MPYSTKALIKNFRRTQNGVYEITFEAEARPNDPKHFTRRFQSGSRELQILQRYSGVSSPPGLAQALDRFPVNYDGSWSLDYSSM